MSEPKIIPGLGGHVPIRNSFLLDYTIELSIRSLLNVCEQVAVVDYDSTDGTWEFLQRFAEQEPRLKIKQERWPKPVRASHEWFVEWINKCRSMLDTKYQVALDGDEYLDDSPDCHQALREACQTKEPSRWFRRNNYWKSPKFLTPINGGPCACRVVRCGRQSERMPSDQPCHPGEFRIVDTATEDNRLLVHHLGFLRKRESFYKKAHVMLTAWFGRFDDRLEKGEREGLQLWQTPCEFTDRLRPAEDPLPFAVRDWFRARGHII